MTTVTKTTPKTPATINPEMEELRNLMNEPTEQMNELHENEISILKLEPGQELTCFICGVQEIASKFKNSKGEKKQEVVLIEAANEDFTQIVQMYLTGIRPVSFAKSFFEKNPTVQKFACKIVVTETVETENGSYLNMKFYTSKL